MQKLSASVVKMIKLYFAHMSGDSGFGSNSSAVLFTVKFVL